MKLIEGLLNYKWAYNKDNAGDTFVFTANSMVKNGNLLMGGGAALAAREAFPLVDSSLGKEIQKTIFDQKYGYVETEFQHRFIGDWYSFYIGAFQTKTIVMLPSSLELIELATNELCKVAEKRQNSTFRLNYPGIGLGGLNPEEVQPIIERLPDNVWVYKINYH